MRGTTSWAAQEQRRSRRNGGATNHQDGPSIFDNKGDTKSTALPGKIATKLAAAADGEQVTFTSERKEVSVQKRCSGNTLARTRFRPGVDVIMTLLNAKGEGRTNRRSKGQLSGSSSLTDKGARKHE